MALDANNEWTGVCACGKPALDSVRCRLGAAHEPLKPKPMPWEKPQEFPWQK